MSAQIHGSDKVRLGVIGCGPITLNAHADAIAKASNIHLQALADRDEALLADMSDRLGPERTYREADGLLDDPMVDLVLIAVHDRFHVPLVRRALAAGKHVLVEKPLGVTVEECEALRSVARNGQRLAVGCNRRFLPGVRATRRFLQQEGGAVMSYAGYYYDSTFRHAVTQANKFPPAVEPGGNVARPQGPDWKATNKRVYNWLTHGPHVLDLARHLIGPIAAVRATHREVTLDPRRRRARRSRRVRMSGGSSFASPTARAATACSCCRASASSRKDSSCIAPGGTSPVRTPTSGFNASTRGSTAAPAASSNVPTRRTVTRSACSSRRSRNRFSPALPRPTRTSRTASRASRPSPPARTAP